MFELLVFLVILSFLMLLVGFSGVANNGLGIRVGVPGVVGRGLICTFDGVVPWLDRTETLSHIYSAFSTD